MTALVAFSFSRQMIAAGVGYALCGWFTLLFFINLHAWSVTASLYGKIPLREAGKMLYFRACSVHCFHLFLPLCGSLLLVATNTFFATTVPIPCIVSLLLLQLYNYTYQSLPPSVLHLGTSQPESVALRHRIERGVYPYRVVALFDPASANNFPEFQRNHLEWDNLRADTKNWEKVAHPLMDMTPKLVLDARVPSPAVVQEVRRVCNNPALVRKTLFVLASDGQAPALVESGFEADAKKLNLINEENAVQFLRASGLTRTTSPDDRHRER